MIHARPDYQRIQDPEGKIGADEPVFLIRATDSTMPKALRAYAVFAEQAGASGLLVDSVYRHAVLVEDWQAANPMKVKVPDLPKGPTS